MNISVYTIAYSTPSCRTNVAACYAIAYNCVERVNIVMGQDTYKPICFKLGMMLNKHMLLNSTIGSSLNDFRVWYSLKVTESGES